ncbi:hypothetical protein XU18_0635 [Perkinsela sp. CCAP 1560/4]|nr:hypothetical protein XU18_4906 [Perkinsela sp. CCAP 1560/4]KNH09040.1 hypothetical protein XU18_0635 [Perkinsela sp. CCAP 1560/4]|eukprot:KNH03830.1 hypothetical protein XU18_4906 [Perkinsela sp. CCAP 1560/4]
MSGVFTSDELKDPTAPSIFSEPTTYSLGATVALCGLTQRYSRFFMSKEAYLGQNLKQPTARLLIPGLVIPILGFSVALGSMQNHEVIRGHVAALLSCGYMAAWGVPFYRTSPVCAFVGATYFVYGLTYHYRRLMLFTDETVWWKCSDFQEIRQYYRVNAKRIY